MSSQNLPSMQEARQLRTSGMDANQMYEEVRAIAGECLPHSETDAASRKGSHH